MFKNSVGKLVLTTVFHGVTLVPYVLVSLYGFGLVLNLTEENLKISQLFLMRNYCYAYLTNWNYVSNFFNKTN